MPRFHFLFSGLPIAAVILLFTTTAQAATPAQKHAIRHLAAMHAGAYGPPTAIRTNNTTRTMTVVFTLPDRSLRLFFVRPNGRVQAIHHRPVVDSGTTPAAPASSPPPDDPAPEGGGYGDDDCGECD